jgi:hypothetical protein
MLNGTITRSPGLTFCTDEPTLLHDPDELVSEGVADPGIRHQTVIKVQVGSADRRQLHPHDCIIGMLDRRNVLLFNADSVGTAIRHGLHGFSYRIDGLRQIPCACRQ